MSAHMMLTDPLGMAMAGSSAKKVGLTPVNVPGKSTKPKSESKTYVFELELGESNEQIYPEFSWAELVKKEKAKEAAAKAKNADKKGDLNPKLVLLNYNFKSLI